MTKQKPPIDRTSYGVRLAKAHQDLEYIKATLADVMLAADRAPDDSALQEQVADLKKQRDRAREAISDLEAMQGAAAKKEVQVDDAAKTARLAELTQQRDAAVARAKQVPVELVDYIAQIGAMWTASHNTLSEAAALTREIVRLAGGKDAVKRFDNGADNAGHGALAAAVGSALAATGMGSTGPTLAPIVHVSPPMRAHTASDLERGLDNLFNRQVEAIDRAVTPATASKETA